MFKRFTEAGRKVCAYRIGRAAILYGIYLVLCLLGSLIALDFKDAAMLLDIPGVWARMIERIFEPRSSSELIKVLIISLAFFVLPHLGALAWIVPKKPRGCLFVLSFVSLVIWVMLMVWGTLLQGMG